MKFRRKSATETAEAVGDETQPVTTEEATGTRPAGPYDADELPDDQAAVERVDLGSIQVAGAPGRELRLQVDEKSGVVQSVLLAGEEGALELRAFAAPRNGDLWSEVRPQLAADVARRGGTSTEREGRWGTELVCQLTVTLPDGQTGTQVSRIIGVNGPRWLLRATLLGKPAVDGTLAASWEQSINDVVVSRGTGAMPVGEALPLTLPPQAKRVG